MRRMAACCSAMRPATDAGQSGLEPRGAGEAACPGDAAARSLPHAALRETGHASGREDRGRRRRRAEPGRGHRQRPRHRAALCAGRRAGARGRSRPRRGRGDGGAGREGRRRMRRVPGRRDARGDAAAAMDGGGAALGPHRHPAQQCRGQRRRRRQADRGIDRGGVRPGLGDQSARHDHGLQARPADHAPAARRARSSTSPRSRPSRTPIRW